jgi:hypothetical protein
MLAIGAAFPVCLACPDYAESAATSPPLGYEIKEGVSPWSEVRKADNKQLSVISAQLLIKEADRNC